MIKKRVSSSHLALRFYKAEGWTREELEACLRPGTDGRIRDTSEHYQEASDAGYFAKADGAWDFTKLMPLISSIQRFPMPSPEILAMTDEQYARYIDW